jgi:hypothetical protein
MTPKWQELGDEYPGVRVQVDRVGGRWRIVGIQVTNPNGVTHDALRQVPVVRYESQLNKPGVNVLMVLPGKGWPPPKRQELRIPKRYFDNPDGRGYGQEFYEKVASRYTRCIAGEVQPAPAIAEANNVPVSTVHRWIREARRRGALAPARTKGAAG